MVATTCHGLEDVEHQVLLADAGDVLQSHRLGKIEQGGCALLLDVRDADDLRGFTRSAKFLLRARLGVSVGGAAFVILGQAVEAIRGLRDGEGSVRRLLREGGSLLLCDLSVELFLGHLDREALVLVTAAVTLSLVVAVVVAGTVVTTTVLHHAGGFRRL